MDQMSQAINRLRAMVSPPKFSPPMPRPATGDRGWMAGSGGVGSGLWQRIVTDPSGTETSGAQPWLRNTGKSADDSERGHHWWHGISR